MIYSKKHISILCGMLLALGSFSYGADAPLLVNIQFGTAEMMFDTKLDSKEEEPNIFVNSFTGNEGVLPGGSYWNLIQPKEASPSVGYAIGGKPLIGTFKDLKDGDENETKISITIDEGSTVSTSTATDKGGSGQHFYPVGYVSLMNSGLSGVPSGLLIFGGLTPAQPYTLVFYGHPMGYIGTMCTGGMSVTVNGVTKNEGPFDFKVTREISEGTDYLQFNNVSPDSSGHLTVTFSGYDTVSKKVGGGGWLSAIQIQAASKPAEEAPKAK